MEYKDIFKPNTIEKLNQQSAENLRKMLGNKSLMQTLQSSMKLLQEVIAIEQPYKQQLEELAIQMVEDMYPIIGDDNIKIDAKIVGLNDVNQELSEIKVNPPASYNPNLEDNYKPFERGKNVKETIQNFLKANPNASGNQIVYIISSNIGYHSKSVGDYLRSTPNIIRQVVKNPKTGRKIYVYRHKDGEGSVHDRRRDINESTPESKRRVINGITQGAALKGAFSFYMFKEYLDAIDPTLVEKYNQLMKEVFGVYDDENAIAMFLQMLAQGQKMGGGSSKVVINEIKVNKPSIFPIRLNTYTDWNKIKYKLDKQGYKWFNDDSLLSDDFDLGPEEFPLELLSDDNKHIYTSDDDNLWESNQKQITIRARAICFPMLVHEIIKGLYELVSLQGFQGTKNQNQAVADKVDKLENEPTDIRYGQQIFNALNDIFVESDYNDDRIREFFFAEVYQLGDAEFVEFIENVINEDLTISQKNWVKQTLKDISYDLRDDDRDNLGIDEIKVNEPKFIPQFPLEIKNQKQWKLIIPRLKSLGYRTVKGELEDEGWHFPTFLDYDSNYRDQPEKKIINYYSKN